MEIHIKRYGFMSVREANGNRNKWNWHQHRKRNFVRCILRIKSSKRKNLQNVTIQYWWIHIKYAKVLQSISIDLAGVIEKIYDENRDSINEDFFRKCVSSVILFDTLDGLISKASWYPKGGNKAQIVPYTIAKLMTIILKAKI